MKISAVTVWFNPENLGNPVERIKSYSKFVDKIYVVDNSQNDNGALLKEVENAHYIPLGKNLGIARALNVGLQKAIDDGFEWCMTMDQDSVWDEGEIKRYFQIAESEKSNYQNFSPAIRGKVFPSLLGNLKRKIFRQHLNSEFFDLAQSEDRWITSGSLMSLAAYRNVFTGTGGGMGSTRSFLLTKLTLITA